MNISIKKICLIGMLAAVTCILSIWQIPTPWGVPYTFQTFAVALCGLVLGAKCGTSAVGIYILLGSFGLPVFAGMTGGISIIAGPRGGYIIGFLPMVFLCGIASKLSKDWYKKLVAMAGLLCCHGMGIIGLARMTQMDWKEAFLAGTLPYILKDILCIFVAFFVAKQVQRTQK